MQLGCANQPSAKNRFDGIDFILCCRQMMRKKKATASQPTICNASTLNKTSVSIEKAEAANNMNKFIRNIIVGKWYLFMNENSRIQIKSRFDKEIKNLMNRFFSLLIDFRSVLQTL